MSSEEDARPEPKSLLGLPLRLVLVLGSIALPLLAVAWFSSTHEWPPAEPCFIAPFGCPSAPYPLAVQAADWLNLVGPLFGFVLAVGALSLRKEANETGLLLMRYVLPVVGIFVSVGCALQLLNWVAHGYSW
jgi:hypothetical protein